MTDHPASPEKHEHTPTFFEIQLQIAYAAGVDAAARDASRAPVHSKVVMSMLEPPNPLSSGEFNEICKAFQLGYQARCDADAEKVLNADD